MLLGIRPESLVPVENGVVNVFEARLVSSAFLGDQVHGQLAIAERVLAAKGRALLAPPGSIVHVAVDPAEVMLFPDGTPPHLANATESRVATALEPLPRPA